MSGAGGVRQGELCFPGECTISRLFRQAQHSGNLGLEEEQRLINELRCIYNQISFEDFVAQFKLCLNVCFFYDEEEKIVEVVLNFAAQFVAYMYKLEVDDKEPPPFLKEILDFVCVNHGCENHLVRSRTCFIIFIILSKLGNDFYVPDKTYKILRRSMLERMKDKIPAVQVRAILAIHRLQNPYDANCPVINALSLRLSEDLSMDVKLVILNNIAICKVTLPHIIQRIYDVQDLVRRDAFSTLNKCSMSRFTIKQQKQLLNCGLEDRDEGVRKFIKGILLPKWFHQAEDNFFTMLKILDVQKRTETSLMVIETLLKNTSIENTVSQVQANLDENKLIPLDQLSPATVFFWRCSVHFLNNLDDKDVILQSVLPELRPLTKYIRILFRDSEDEKKLELCRQQRIFVASQLLHLCNVHDLSNQLGRYRLKQLCKELIHSPQIGQDAFPLIKDVFRHTVQNMEEFLAPLVDNSTDLEDLEAVSNITETSNRKKDNKVKEKTVAHTTTTSRKRQEHSAVTQEMRAISLIDADNNQLSRQSSSLSLHSNNSVEGPEDDAESNSNFQSLMTSEDDSSEPLEQSKGCMNDELRITRRKHQLYSMTPQQHSYYEVPEGSQTTTH